jgi:hypothetical protein
MAKDLPSGYAVLTSDLAYYGFPYSGADTGPESGREAKIIYNAVFRGNEREQLPWLEAEPQEAEAAKESPRTG